MRRSDHTLRTRKAPSDMEGLYRGEAVPSDPWGAALVLRKASNARGYEILSLGPDGIEHTADDLVSTDP